MGHHKERTLETDSITGFKVLFRIHTHFKSRELETWNLEQITPRDSQTKGRSQTRARNREEIRTQEQGKLTAQKTAVNLRNKSVM